MAYNKTKYVDAALKYLHQGKLPQAIGEYQQILKYEPKDQITLMTVGDLFVRQGDTFQALEYFERLAQIYLSDGFVTKAIAIYKKIAKLAPEESRPVERLAELYVQQGVLSEARPIYLQLAEMHQRASRPVQAAALLRKLLDAEPDNLRAQTRLAEISLAAGNKTEAAAAFCAAARQLLARGDHAEAIKNVDRALQAEPDDAAATTLKVRIHAASGQQKEAIALLEATPDLAAGGEAASLLLDLYLEMGDTQKAEALASKVFARNPKNSALALKVATAYLDLGDADRTLELMDRIREALTDAGEHEALSQMLTRMAEKWPDRLEPLQWQVEHYGRTSDSFRLPDALASLAQAYEKIGKNDEALKTFEQLLDRDPENESARRQVDRLRIRLGVAAAPPPAEPEASSSAASTASTSSSAAEAEAKPATAPVTGEPADEETQRFVSQALTDVDLFSSYGLTQKAVDLLETVLQRAPGHSVALERLLDLYLGAGNDRRTAELAARLETIYRDRGDVASTERFSELRRRFERVAAASGPVEAAQPAPAPAGTPPPFAVPVVDAKPMPVPVAAAVVPTVVTPTVTEVRTEDLATSSVHEVDLSEEWAALSGQVETVAHSSEATTAPVAASSEASGANGKTAESEPEYFLELDASTSDPVVVGDAAADEAQTVLSGLSADFEAAVPALIGSQAKPAMPPQAVPSAPQEVAARVESAPRAVASSRTMEAPARMEARTETRTDAPVDADELAGPLSEVFNQFRAELGENSSEQEDLETHYNLGIAYREMGLVEEAISEFQKVAKSKNNQAFRYAMQCCTLLGLAFMDRGQPSIAAMWYERAIQTPGLDQETILALRYDLGVAQELAGDTSAARNSFSQVYGMNIDYRDVGERLAALGKEQR